MTRWFLGPVQRISSSPIWHVLSTALGSISTPLVVRFGHFTYIATLCTALSTHMLYPIGSPLRQHITRGLSSKLTQGSDCFFNTILWVRCTMFRSVLMVACPKHRQLKQLYHSTRWDVSASLAPLISSYDSATTCVRWFERMTWATVRVSLASAYRTHFSRSKPFVNCGMSDDSHVSTVTWERQRYEVRSNCCGMGRTENTGGCVSYYRYYGCVGRASGRRKLGTQY